MILKELFLKVGFDSIRPHLERFEPEYLDSIYPKSVIRLWVDCPLMSCSMLLA